MSRHNETLSLALTADTMRTLQLHLTKQDELGESLVSIEDAVKKIEINTRIAVNDQKQRVFDYFMRVSRSRI